MLVTFLFQYFIVTPAIGGVFIAGFMAPRASWLLGLIVGLVAATAYSFLVLNGYIGLAPNAETQTQAQDVVFASYLMSPIVGAFFASTAAWYRRFLYLSNPNRGRGRPGTPTRPDGRTRARNANQKAERAPLTFAVNPAGACRHGRADGHRPADPDLRPRRPHRGVTGSRARRG